MSFGRPFGFLCVLWIVGIVLTYFGISGANNDGSIGLLVAGCVVNFLCLWFCRCWFFMHWRELNNSPTTPRGAVTLSTASNLEHPPRPVLEPILKSVVVQDQRSQENVPLPSYYEVVLNPLQLEEISQPVVAQNLTRTQPTTS
jgi:hypothetical protein